MEFTQLVRFKWVTSSTYQQHGACVTFWPAWYYEHMEFCEMSPLCMYAPGRHGMPCRLENVRTRPFTMSPSSTPQQSCSAWVMFSEADITASYNTSWDRYIKAVKEIWEIVWDFLSSLLRGTLEWENQVFYGDGYVCKCKRCKMLWNVIYHWWKRRDDWHISSQ